jgi:hypothetical protein
MNIKPLLFTVFEISSFLKEDAGCKFLSIVFLK